MAMQGKISDLEKKLLDGLWITAEQLAAAKADQKKSKKSLYAALVKLGYLTEEDTYIFFAQHSRIPFVRISDYLVDSGLIDIFPESYYREHLFFPLFKIGTTLYVCMANPMNSELAHNLNIHSQCDIIPVFAMASSIKEAINRHFGPEDVYAGFEPLMHTPQPLKKLPFWRESQRLAVRLTVEFKVDDEKVNLASSAYISATATDISSSGKAMAIKTFIFIPTGITIAVRFPAYSRSYTAYAEVARCTMEKGGAYFLGAKFLDIRQDLVNWVLRQREKDK